MKQTDVARKRKSLKRKENFLVSMTTLPVYMALYLEELKDEITRLH